MAKKTVVEYVDDLDGLPVGIDELHTIEWSWLGASGTTPSITDSPTERRNAVDSDHRPVMAVID